MQLREHVRKDYGIGFRCDQCNEEFKYDEELEEHMKMNHVMELECIECNEKFTSKDELAEQVRMVHVHTEREECKEDMRKEYKMCSRCDEMFKDKDDLEEHIWIDHELKCEKCNKQYTCVVQLEEH